MIRDLIFIAAALIGAYFGIKPTYKEYRRTRNIEKQTEIDLKLRATEEAAYRALEEGRKVTLDGEMPKRPLDPEIIKKRGELRALGRPEHIIDHYYPLEPPTTP